MNLFHDYQRKIFVSLKKLEIKKKIKIPHEIKKFATELPPKEQNADISCNAAMVLANANNSSPLKLAEIFKNHFWRINFYNVKWIFRYRIWCSR